MNPMFLVAKLPKAPDGGARPARQRGILGPGDAPQQAPQHPGIVQFDSKDRITGYYTTEEAAIAACKFAAEMHPTTPYAWFRIDSVFETTAPTLIEKTFNESNEVVIKQARRVSDDLI